MNKIKEKLQIFKNSRVRYGTVGTVITILVIILTLVLNMGMSGLGKAHNLNLDLTRNHAFKLSDESIKFLKTLDKKVEIVVLNSEENFVANGEYFTQANEVLKQYSQFSGNIKLSYVDMEENPTYLYEYASEDLQSNSILVRSGDNHTTLTAMDIFDVESSYQGTSIVSSGAEQAMSSAIMNVTNDKKVKVSLISGFDEENSSSFEDLLEKNNYEVSTQTILTENIDADSEVVIIYGPKRDYDNDAIEKLKKYIYNDGKYSKNIFYIATPNLNESPNLNEFLNDYNIKLGDGIVYETNPKNLLTLNSPFYATNEYVDSEYSGEIKNKDIPVSLPYSHPIEILDELKVTTLLQFSESAGIVPSNAGEAWSPSSDDKKGPIPAMTISEKTEEGAVKPSSVVVSGSILGFDDTFLSRSSLNNSSYFLNVFNKLTNQKLGIQIESKTVNSQELGINSYQATVISIILTLVLPLAIALVGVIVWIKRRNK